MPDFAPEECHAHLLDNAPVALTFERHRHRQFEEWRAELDGAVRTLLGPTPAPIDVDVRREADHVHGDYREIRFTFTAEVGAEVPCHLLLPTTGEGPFPVVICLQGHTSGMHLSMGRPLEEADWAMLRGGRDFALQAIKEGYAALVLEQRCFGERADQRPKYRHTFPDRCHHASMTAQLLGRTMVGERAFDVSRAIDALETFDDLPVDVGRIASMGNSGGGCTTLWAAALDQRISALMPSCYVCTFRDSIASIDHCADNYVPGLLLWFEMADLAGLLVPRPTVVVAGRHDPLFPIAAVERTAEAMQAIFDAQGAGERFRLVVGEEGHQFYPELGWPAFREVTGW